jgi:hypothetical protein
MDDAKQPLGISSYNEFEDFSALAIERRLRRTVIHMTHCVFKHAKRPETSRR